MIELKSINVIFDKNTNREAHVIKDLDLTVSNGDFITIIGGNGAGKSTLMNLLAGDLYPSNGQIFIDGINVTKLSTEKRSSMVARVFQDPMIGTCSELTIEENMSIAYKRGNIRGIDLSINTELRSKFQKILQNLEMGLENRLSMKVSGLSGGQRQALSLIMATIQGSKILLLDEHTAALDPKIAKLIMEITAKLTDMYKLTALMITHSMSQALHYGNRTIMMSRGKIVKDIDAVKRNNLAPNDLIKYFDLEDA
ncbi:MAG: ATP-binding cassette domain-containing protein [Pseudomonadota bacterium]